MVDRWIREGLKNILRKRMEKGLKNGDEVNYIKNHSFFPLPLPPSLSPPSLSPPSLSPPSLSHPAVGMDRKRDGERARERGGKRDWWRWREVDRWGLRKRGSMEGRWNTEK